MSQSKIPSVTKLCQSTQNLISTTSKITVDRIARSSSRWVSVCGGSYLPRNGEFVIHSNQLESAVSRDSRTDNPLILFPESTVRTSPIAAWHSGSVRRRYLASLVTQKSRYQRRRRHIAISSRATQSARSWDVAVAFCDLGKETIWSSAIESRWTTGCNDLET